MIIYFITFLISVTEIVSHTTRYASVGWTYSVHLYNETHAAATESSEGWG